MTVPYKSYITFSTLVAAFYVAVGNYFFAIHPENLLLAAIIVVLCGMLPNIDASREEPAKEMGALLAAVSPFIVLELFPELRDGGIARISLVIIGTYIITNGIGDNNDDYYLHYLLLHVHCILA